jgi:hypothetical protein
MLASLALPSTHGPLIAAASSRCRPYPGGLPVRRGGTVSRVHLRNRQGHSSAEITRVPSVSFYSLALRTLSRGTGVAQLARRGAPRVEKSRRGARSNGRRR